MAGKSKARQFDGWRRGTSRSAAGGNPRSNRMKRRFILVTLQGLIVSGCALHPLPDDVTKLSTYNIVRQIRCETRKGVIDSILGYLTDERNYKGHKVDENSREVGRKFQAVFEADPFSYTNQYSISNFSPELLSGYAKMVVSVLWNTGIAYNFDLTMAETNNIGSEINFLRPLTRSSTTVGLKGNFDRQRQNERSFTVTDNFGDLTAKLRADYCTKQIVEANMIYPIAGKVGMERVVQDFLVLTLFGNLAGDATEDITSAKGPPTMVEQLEFQTTIGGSATPKVTFTPLGSGVRVSDASLGVAASRKDTHKLTVGLYLVPPGVHLINEARPGIFQGLITATGGKPEQGAARAVDQFLSQKLFQTNITINQ